MIDILIKSPLLVLFIIMAVGYVVGRVRIGSFSLGVAGVLFAGIAISALDPRLALSPIIYQLGLVLFVYTTGIALGPTFFAGLRKTGLRDNALTLGMVTLGGVGIAVIASLLHLSASLATGLYTGTFTVTPALAGVLESLGGKNAAPVVGYSLAYPLSVLASLLLVGVFRKLWKIDAQERERSTSASLNPHSIQYERTDTVKVGDVSKLTGTYVSVSRIKYKGKVTVAKPAHDIHPGSVVTVVGTDQDVEKVVKWMGKRVTQHRLEFEENEYRHRRVFISNEKVAGKRLGDLHLNRNYHVALTRIRRGDIDMIAHDDTVLELGDRARMVGTQQDLDAAALYLGDSYTKVSHFSIMTFAAGIALGIALGAITIPLPNGGSFSLGAAGGTIIVALVLGALRRTGPLVWQLPYGTNVSIRQLGLVVFLAGVGSTAGSALVKKALSDPASYYMMAASFALSLVVVTAMLVVGYKLLKIPFTRLSGMVAAMNTQPATLAYANELTKTDEANEGYASVYPLSLLGKIIIAQILLILLTA